MDISKSVEEKKEMQIFQALKQKKGLFQNQLIVIHFK